MLRALVAAQPAGETRPPEKTAFEGYGAAKEALRAVVGDKCWYCEHKLDGKYDPIEHYRPKPRASREHFSHRDGYWWLAWTWPNLMLLCDDCNKAKGMRFPLHPDCVPLVAEQTPPADEAGLMIDPCAVDPFLHLRFEQDRQGVWRARPVPGSSLGEKTIEVLGLDGLKKRPGIVDQYRAHVTLAVQPHAERVLEKSRAGDVKEVFRVWDKACRTLLRKGTPYAALSYHALDRRISAQTRRRWGLVLPPPPWDPLTGPPCAATLA